MGRTREVGGGSRRRGEHEKGGRTESGEERSEKKKEMECVCDGGRMDDPFIVAARPGTAAGGEGRQTIPETAAPNPIWSR